MSSHRFDAGASDRMSHPRLDLADPYGEASTDLIRQAVVASPTGFVRVYQLGSTGTWDTHETADIVTIDEFDNLSVVDFGSA